MKFPFDAKRLLFENFDSPRNKTQRKAKFKKRIHSLNKTWSKTFIKRENKIFLNGSFQKNLIEYIAHCINKYLNN